MIEPLIVGLLAVAFLYFVLQPLRVGQRPERNAAGDAREELHARKRAALGAILDIEGERDAGKLSAEDFAALRREYEAEAIEALRALEATSVDARPLDRPEPDDALEAEIAALRAELVCPECGAPRPRGERCARCGAD